MDFFTVIEARRSVRSFQPEAVPSEMLTLCLNAARLAPSSTNSQPWKFVVVRDQEKLAQLAAAGYDQKCLREAPVITVALGDRNIYKKRLRRAKELSDIGAVSEDDLANVEEIYKNRKEDKEGEIRSITANTMIAIEHYVLAATAQGLGACWVMLFQKDKVAELLNLTPDYFPLALIPTGFPNEEQPLRPRYSLGDIAWDNEIGKPWQNI